MNIMLAHWEFYQGANQEYMNNFSGLGVSDDFFYMYCMGGEL